MEHRYRAACVMDYWLVYDNETGEVRPARDHSDARIMTILLNTGRVQKESYNWTRLKGAAHAKP